MNCPVCQKDYSNKGLYTHMARAHGSEEERAKYAGGNHGKYHLVDFKKFNGAVWDKKLGKIEKRFVSCFKCEKQFEVQERTSQKKEKYFCSRSCANSRGVCSEKQKNQTSETILRRLQNGEIHYTFRGYQKLVACKECGENFLRSCFSIQTLCWIHRASNNCIICQKLFHNVQRWTCSKECNSILLQRNAFKIGLGGKRNSKKFRICNSGKEVILDSSYELSLAEDLNRNNIHWIRPKAFKYFDGQVFRKYYPDFYLPEQDVYLDPKNDYLIQIDSKKIQLVQEQNSIRVLILNSRQLTWEAVSKEIKAR